MNPAEKTIRDFMAAFVAAWPRRDHALVASFFSKDAVYINGPLEPVTGRDAIATTLATFMDLGGHVDVDVAHLLTDGPIVMIERVDHFIGSQGRASLPMMGIFEVHEGAITAWRDYFDLNHFTSQLPTTA